MSLRSWPVIAVLALVGIALLFYWMSLPPAGVTPQGDEPAWITAVAALAGAITTLGGAIFGVLGKLNEYRKAKLELAEKELELAEKKKKFEAE